MTIEYKLPDLGEDIESGDVISVFVSPGDTVEKEQPLLEVETDKAAIEIPAPEAGIITGIHVAQGDTIKIGQLLVTIDDEATSEATAQVQSTKIESSLEEIEEPDQQKQTEDTSAPEVIPDNTSKEEPEPIAADTQPPPNISNISKSDIPAPASPSVRRLAREFGVDINQVHGSGPGGKISEDDIKNFVKGEKPAVSESEPISTNSESAPTPESVPHISAAPAGAPAPSPTPPPDSTKWGQVERVHMSKVRRLTAQRLTVAWTAPHVTQHDKADITELEKLRKQYGNQVADAGGKLTMTSVILKVSAAALIVFPQFNASVDMEHGEIVYKKYCNIGVAVDTDRGLLVPVIKDANKKNITELSAELSDLSARARDKKVTANELQGGTFTISNLGGIGGTYFTPVLNAPEVAILGISRSEFEPVYIDDEFIPRLMLPLSLSYDHRLIDGADAARFLRWIVEALEQPFKLALEG